jgi:hypothetical protein
MKIHGWMNHCGLVASLVVAINTGAGQKANVIPQQGTGAEHSCSTVLPSKNLVREIDDVGLRAHWMLFRDDSRPGGPGRLVLKSSCDNLREATVCELGLNRRIASKTFLEPVIRAGDQLVVQEHTSRVDMKLKGVAIGPAAVGDVLSVRLSVVGRTVQAIALKAGLATLLSQPEVRP